MTKARMTITETKRNFIYVVIVIITNECPSIIKNDFIFIGSLAAQRCMRKRSLFTQAHPATFFCKITVGKNKYCLEISKA